MMATVNRTSIIVQMLDKDTAPYLVFINSTKIADIWTMLDDKKSSASQSLMRSVLHNSERSHHKGSNVYRLDPRRHRQLVEELARRIVTLRKDQNIQRLLLANQKDGAFTLEAKLCWEDNALTIC